MTKPKALFIASICLAVLTVAVPAHASSGDLDTGFDGDGIFTWGLANPAEEGASGVAVDPSTEATVIDIPAGSMGPGSPEMKSQVTAKVKKVVEDNGLRFVDLLPTVENLDPASLWVTVPDPHPNARADAAFADGMLKELVPMLDELCRTEKKGC